MTNQSCVWHGHCQKEQREQNDIGRWRLQPSLCLCDLALTIAATKKNCTAFFRKFPFTSTWFHKISTWVHLNTKILRRQLYALRNVPWRLHAAYVMQEKCAMTFAGTRNLSQLEQGSWVYEDARIQIYRRACRHPNIMDLIIFLSRPSFCISINVVLQVLLIKLNWIYRIQIPS